MKNRSLLLLGVVSACLASISPVFGEDANYAPVINPAEFSTDINNPFMRLPPGRRLHYRENTEEGVETIEIWMTGETRTIMGVETAVYFDRVSVDGDLVEQTKDYLAINRSTGDVWYFGEEVDNYENGRFRDHEGSWIGGVDGALPGVWFKGAPRAGEEYRMEFYRGEAEDMSRVEGVGQRVQAGGRTYQDCVQVYEWTPLDPDSREDKYYCRDVGATVLTVDRESGLRGELVSIDEPH